MPCSQAKCAKAPAWRPALEVRQVHGGPARKLRFTKLGYCAEHKKAATLDTFLSQEGWTKITKHLRELGLGEHDRHATTLTWEKIREPETTILDQAPPPDDSLPF